MDERWLPVVGYEGLYEVSNLGAVLSLPRLDRLGRRVKGGILAGTDDGQGYRQVNLSRDGECRPRRVYRLVLEAFVGPCPPGMEALHGPAGQKDDSVTSLCWGTDLQNQQDRSRDGTDNNGERNGQAKLTTAQALAILSRKGENQRFLAEEYHVSQSHISMIQNGKVWRSLCASDS